MSIPITEPTEVQAGATLKVRKTLADYPASAGWALSYQFRGTGAGHDATTTADGDSFLLTVPAGTTQSWAAGLWVWQAWVEKSGERYLADNGQFTVSAVLPAANTSLDARSTTKRTLDAIEAMIGGKASLDQQEYQIGNRMLRRYTITELIELRREYRKTYAQELQAESKRTGKPLRQNVLTRFTKPV
jgi:hypothetical protein